MNTERKVYYKYEGRTLATNGLVDINGTHIKTAFLTIKSFFR